MIGVFTMLKLNILELLDKNGKTKYWLYKQLGMSYQNFTKMINQETRSIRYENIEAIDEILNANSVGWPVTRMPKTDLAIARLATCEIKYMEEIPVSVSINEAVEICKKYATEEDASFVNGILSSVVKKG